MKRIERAKIKALLEALKEKYTVFAPILKNGTVVFDRMEDVESVQLHFSNTVHSPKALFFPQTEQLLSQIEDGWKENLPPEENSILFGLRPCDARGIGLLDKVFSGDDFEDPYYLIRREKSLIVSLACQHPRMSCFCSSLNSGPHAEEAADIILFETSDAYLLKALSDKGEQLVKEVSGLLSKPKASDQGELEKQKKAAEKKLATSFKLDKLDKKLGENFEHQTWDEIHEKCLGCGACTYLCPTCHCFDIIDEANCRIRSWDSCQFCLFTLHASGHNPRPAGREKMRQRIMHKFSYCPDNFDETFCVGCGRCIQCCPVNFDIRSVVNGLAEELES